MLSSISSVGYDTAAHIAEETTNSHNSSPYGMIFAVVNALILGVVLILGLNFCIQNIDSDDMNDITSFWQLIVGNDLTVFFQVIIDIRIVILSSNHPSISTDNHSCGH